MIDFLLGVVVVGLWLFCMCCHVSVFWRGGGREREGEEKKKGRKIKKESRIKNL